jgi:hypothetical protein
MVEHPFHAVKQVTVCYKAGEAIRPWFSAGMPFAIIAKPVTETLDFAVKARLRAALDRRSATESELRKLTEEGQACVLILDARLERSERHLAELSSDPASSLAEIAAEVRAADELRPDLDELHALLAELNELARESRASWLGARPA